MVPLRLTSTSYVILGMIRLGRRTGYEIKGFVDNSTRFFWAVSYGQIYPELKRLEAAGLIEGRPEPHGGRPRTVYSLLPAGEKAFHDWLTTSPELLYEVRDEGLLKFFFGDSLSLPEAIAHVEAMEERHERVLAHLRALEPLAAEGVAAGGPRFPYLSLEFGLGLHSFAVEWCRRMKSDLAESPPAGAKPVARGSAD